MGGRPSDDARPGAPGAPGAGGESPSYGSYEPAASVARALGRAGRRKFGARIVEVEPGGPAAREGLEAGMIVTHVNGEELRDMIDWDWEADGPSVYLEGVAYEGTPEEFEFECELGRAWGEDWGLTFDGAVFDGMRLCRNDCLFCFMKMLPKGMRKTLYMRDDDYRLSFLQGNFVTLTNLSEADVDRIVSHALSPLNVSLHAVSPDVRRRLIGKNAQRGMDVLETLVANGVEVHAQIVLVPGENDGEELARTLAYVEARPPISSLGIVPVGFTKHQDAFSRSFDDPALAAAVIEAVRPYQDRSRALSGRTRYQLADEFYINAGVEPPPAAYYDGYPQYQDGIGMVRSFLDDASCMLGRPEDLRAFEEAAARLAAAGERALFVTGEAAFETVRGFVEATPLARAGEVVAVKNRYFGGNVNVTGLLTATDVLDRLPVDLAGRVVAIPDIMLNVDRLTLDGVSEADLLARIADRKGRGVVLRPMPQGLLDAVGYL